MPPPRKRAVRTRRAGWRAKGGLASGFHAAAFKVAYFKEEVPATAMYKKSSVLLLCLAPACVLAQEQEGVVVSATRAPRPSLEVPASVDRIYGDEIREGRPQVNLSESL